MARTANGYTLFELLLVIAIIGAVAALTIPRVKGPMLRESVRSARRAMVTQLAVARGAAASRGCRSVVHVVDGASARTWVTACATTGAGVDTVGTVEELSDRYGVAVQSSVDSIAFAPNGLAIGSGWASLSFDRVGYSDSLSVSPLGKAYW
ncbi:MAG: prepilin-type N-terminal cleavage/methylation domain-containing protein [Gemmatimonadota bacterium]|nr:MAG: prepilin-type N-terminal cleavage/methylation domain-containing protein [Gemmatimonadota bacterium]